MNERTTAEVSPPGGSSRCLGHRDSGEGDCGIKQMAYTGKTSETVGRKAMGPNAVSGRAKNCPWTILIVGRSPTIMSTVRESAGRSPAGNGSPAADFGKPPETTGRKAMGSKRPEGRRTARPQN